jgi:hypothetical protein
MSLLGEGNFFLFPPVRVVGGFVGFDYVGIVGVLLGLQGLYGLILWVVCRVLLWVVVLGSCGCS